IAQERSRWIKVASAYPLSPTTRNRRGINRTDWLPISARCTTAASTAAITAHPGRQQRARARTAARFDDGMSEKCQKLEGGYGPLARNPLSFWSGRPDSNRRRPAWEAGILPLNYGRPAPLSYTDRVGAIFRPC